MKTGIIAIVALIVGAGGSYYYMQGQVDEISSKVTTAEAQLAEANEQAQTAASEVEALQSDIGEKTKMIEDQQARIAELEAAAQAAPAPQ